VIERLCLWLALTAVLAAPNAAAAQEVVQPWERLGANLAGIYGWPNLAFHLGAAAVTPPLMLAADEPVQVYFQKHDPLSAAFGTGAFFVGGAVPILIPAALYLGGLATSESELASAGAAAVQAMVVQFAAVNALKWLTDRAGPYPDGDPSKRRWYHGLLHDSLRANDFDFNPFDLHGGVRWPSGHTASNVALVSALYGFYPDQPWIALIGYPYALAVGIGMVEGDYHWLSDVVAGALIGHVIGWVIGKQMRAAYDERNRTKGVHAAERGSDAYLSVGIMPQALGPLVIGAF
jgi:membrane-associated phospholipid phosphatase